MLAATVNALASFTEITALVAVLIPTLAGWGQFAFRLYGVQSPSRLSTSSMWLGFAVILALVELIHFFRPIDWVISLLVASIGCSSFFRGFIQSEYATCRAIADFLRRHWLYVLVGLFFTVIWAFRAMQTPGNFDSGLYHFGSIKWLNEAPLIPGLANVHMRFGFNQSYFGFLALCNMAPLWNKGYATGGFFLLILTCATLIEVGMAQSKRWRYVFWPCLFVYIATSASVVENPSPDIAVYLIEIPIFVFLFRLLQANNRSQCAQDAVVVMSLCAAALTIKLSTVVFASTCGLFALILCCQYRYLARLTWCVLLSTLVLIVVTHLLRSVLLSGAPFFPSPLLGQWGLPWAVKPGVAQYESLIIYSWARTPGVLTPYTVLRSWDWLEPWFHGLTRLTRLTFGVAVLFGSLNLVSLIRRSHNNAITATYWLYVPLVSALVFWFFTAPDPRFLGAILPLLLTLGAWQFALNQWGHYGDTLLLRLFKHPATNRVLLVVVGVVMLKLSGITTTRFTGWHTIPNAAITQRRTDYGLDVNIAKSYGPCWSAPLPCSPYFDGNLHKVPMILPHMSIPLGGRYYFSVIPK